MSQNSCCTRVSINRHCYEQEEGLKTAMNFFEQSLQVWLIRVMDLSAAGDRLSDNKNDHIYIDMAVC